MGGSFPRYSPLSGIVIQKPVIKFPSNSHVLTKHLLVLFLCFLCPRDIISARGLHQSKDSVLQIHPSSVINETRREESLLLPRQIEELMMSATSSSPYGLRSRVRSIFDSDTIASGRVQHKINRIFKSIPQILPLPPTSRKNAADVSEARMISLYLHFIEDICKEKAWSVIRILVDWERSLELCGYLQEKLFRKESAIHAEYCGEATGDSPSSNDDKKIGKGDLPQSNSRLTVPIFSFYFIRSKNKTETGRVAFHPKLLINYLPFRPVFVLSGGENRDIIIDGVQPESPANFKWTLVYPASNSSWKGSSESSQPSSLEELYLEDIYGIGSSSEPLTQPIGSWSRKNGLKIDADNALGLSNFRGRTFRITTVAAPPFVYIDEKRSAAGKVICKGYLPDILDVLSVQLNFTFEMMTPSDKLFGNVYSNGSWSGMVGMLQKKEADIAMTSFSLTTQRKNVMDFSPPVEYSSVRLLIRRDWQNQEIKWSAYLQPLDTKVWVAIPISICLGVITLAVFARTKILEITPVNSLILLSSCFVLQGQNEHSTIKVTPYRLVLGTFWLLAVFLFACYTARLTSFLAATTENLPVKSLAQAIQSKNWKVGLTKGSAFIDRIKESRVDVLKSLSHRLSEDSSGLVGSFQEGMDKVFKERYVFFTSELVPSFLIKGNCSYTWLPDRYFSGFGYMGYQKYLPHAAVISQKIAEIRETGQMQRLFLKWWGRDSICNLGNAGDSFLGMSLYETGTAFLILILGITFSITLLAAECLKTPGKLFTLLACFSKNTVVDIQSTNNQSQSRNIATSGAPKLEILNPNFSYNYQAQYAMFLKR